MSFQYVFDNAESISIRARPNVSQSISRNNTVRSVSRGGENIRIFRVRLPDGIPWTQLAPIIQSLEATARTTPQTVTINHPGYASWINNGLLSNPNQTYNVICVEQPEWTIFARNQVSWSGDFVFYEVV